MSASGPYRDSDGPACDAKTRTWERVEALLSGRAAEIIGAAVVLALSLIWLLFAVAQEPWHLAVSATSVAATAFLAAFICTETDGPRSHALAILTLLYWLALTVVSVAFLVLVPS